MEGGRGDGVGGAGVVTAASPEEQRRQWRRHGGGGGGHEEESDGSSASGGGGGLGLELSLRLRTGDGHDAPAPTPAAGSKRKRNMTIFYNGRVCAVDVTEVQARAIISMASDEVRPAAEDHRQQDSGSGRGSDGLLRPVIVAAAVAASPAAAASPRLGGFAVAPVMDQAATGLSMKRSLQRFLQKRQARTAAAVAPPYAAGGGWQAQAMRH